MKCPTCGIEVDKIDMITHIEEIHRNRKVIKVNWRGSVGIGDKVVFYNSQEELLKKKKELGR